MVVGLKVTMKRGLSLQSSQDHRPSLVSLTILETKHLVGSTTRFVPMLQTVRNLLGSAVAVELVACHRGPSFNSVLVASG